MELQASEKAARLACWRGPVAPEPVAGGISNANFKVVDRGEAFFVRIGEDEPVHGVSRRREVEVSRAAHAAGLSPEVVHAEAGAIVFRFLDARTLRPEEVRDPLMLGRIVALVREVHRTIAACHEGPLPSFRVFDVLRDYERRLRAEDHRLAGQLDGMTAATASLEGEVGRGEPVFAHNDLLAANLLDDGERLWLIDWEYGGLNDPLFDLGNLATNNQVPPDGEDLMLALYAGVPPDDALRCRYRAWACVSLLREVMWSMVSEHHLSVDFDYAAYTDLYLDRFWRAFADRSGRPLRTPGHLTKSSG